MRINKIEWENYRGLKDGSIEANGENILITGENGTGKTSIASILTFVLFGKEKLLTDHYIDGVMERDNKKSHSATIQFDSGLTLKREVFCSADKNTYKYYINGESTTASKFAMKVYTLTNGSDLLTCDPFAFNSLKVEERRKILSEVFGEVSEVDLLKTDEFSPLTERLQGKNVSAFIERGKLQLKAMRQEVQGYPARIMELQRITPMTLPELDGALEKLFAQKEKLRNVEAPQSVKSLEICLLERKKLLSDAPKLDVNPSQQQYLRGELKRLEKDVEQCRIDYRKYNKQAAKICQECGQKISAEKFERQRQENLKRITERGLQLKDRQVAVAKELRRVEAALQETESIREKRSALEAEIEKLMVQREKTLKEERDKWRADNDKLTKQIAELSEQKTRAIRMKELLKESQELQEKILLLESDLELAKNLKVKQVELAESTINSNFKNVKFKLYELERSGELKNVCEAMMHGVPYNQLSHGEKLKASLEIFVALQNHFKVEFPLMIDDAESFTVPIDLPNQIFLFKVGEGQLKVVIGKAREVA